jgi:hypothetical protein
VTDWKTLESAPTAKPVKVWASYDPKDRLMTFRQFLAIQKFQGWWEEYGVKPLRLFPTHWKELDEPE